VGIIIEYLLKNLSNRGTDLDTYRRGKTHPDVLGEEGWEVGLQTGRTRLLALEREW
jgi:hypothetical protein